MSARKYILIPEYRPLYAMARCWGPLHGPLTKPTPTPIDVIGELLQQTGNEQVTIYETKPDPEHPHQMLPHIRLTRDNYMLPYDEIAGRTQSAKSMEEVPVTTPTPVEPTIVEDKPETISEIDTGEAETAVYQEPEQEETVPETVDTPSETAVTAVTDTTPADSVPEVESISTEDMPADTTGSLTTEDDQNTTAPDTVTVTGSAPEQRVHMTKAERRAARRAAEAAKNQTEQN